MAHDLIFYKNRSTPEVVPRGAKGNPDSDDVFSSRRQATAEEEEWMRNNPGKWLRVDEKGNKPSSDSYKKTRKKGRAHLVRHTEMKMGSVAEYIEHYGVKGMRWGVRSATNAAVPHLSNSRTRAIKTARSSVTSKEAKIKATTDPTKKSQLKKDLKQDPEYVAARLSTKGESAARKVLAVSGVVGYIAIKSALDDYNYAQDQAAVDREIENFDSALPNQRSGPMFNPDATLDSSRVRNAS